MPQRRCGAIDRPLQRQTLLSAALTAEGLRHFPGEGKHPANDWPAEPSFLILGVDMTDAAQLGSEHDQNAVVWCGSEGVPQLLLLR